MKVLPLEFTSKTFTYRQVKREGNVAIYSQHDHPTSKPGAYEVVVIKSHNGYVMAGVPIPAAEMYPSDSSWGKLGWTYSLHLDAKAFDSALDKMSQVLEAITTATP